MEERGGRGPSLCQSFIYSKNIPECIFGVGNYYGKCFNFNITSLCQFLMPTYPRKFEWYLGAFPSKIKLLYSIPAIIVKKRLTMFLLRIFPGQM